MLDGVEATDRQLMATLERYGVKPIDTETANSIPICIRPSRKCRATASRRARIVDVVQTGFMIGDRLLRPAMVTVARGETTASSSSGVDTKT